MAWFEPRRTVIPNSVERRTRLPGDALGEPENDITRLARRAAGLDGGGLDTAGQRIGAGLRPEMSREEAEEVVRAEVEAANRPETAPYPIPEREPGYLEAVEYGLAHTPFLGPAAQKLARLTGGGTYEKDYVPTAVGEKAIATASGLGAASGLYTLAGGVGGLVAKAVGLGTRAVQAIAGAAAFALPTAGEKLVERAPLKEVLTETGKSAIVGGAMPVAGRLAPRGLKTAAEALVLGAGPALLERRLPETEELVTGAAIVGGFKGLHGLARAAARYGLPHPGESREAGFARFAPEGAPPPPEGYPEPKREFKQVREDYYVYHKTRRDFVSVEAEPVRVPGSEGFDLFLHEAIEGKEAKPEHRYTVSEGRTGGVIAHGANPEGAVAATERVLGRFKGEEVEQHIKSTMRQSGLSPRYERTEVASPLPLRELIESEATAQEKAQRMLALAKERGLSRKEIQEDVEVEVTKMADEIAGARLPSGVKMEALVKLYNRQPVLSARTSTSVELQAYSTPAPLAFVASRMIEADAAKAPYEPTAGNGMLLIALDKTRVTANELDPRRLENLRKLGVANLTEEDARVFKPQTTHDAILMNPPFGPLKETVNYQGYAIKRLDHLIALRALEPMTPTGKAVLILGAQREPGRIGQGADRTFLNYLYNHFNVADHFEVSGELYGRQGAKWPVRVVVLDGRRLDVPAVPQDLAPKSVDRLDSWGIIYNRGEEVRNGIAARRGGVDAGGGGADVVRAPAGPSAAQELRPVAIPPSATAPSVSGGGGAGRVGPGGGVAERIRGPESLAGLTLAAIEGQRRPTATPRIEGERRQPSGGLEGRGAGGILPPIPAGEPREREVVGGRPERGVISAKPRVLVGRKVTEGLNEYIPLSAAPPLDTSIAANIAQPVAQSLGKLRKAVGDVDEWLRGRLGYHTKQEMFQALGGEQVDGTAAAIYQIENGGAFIVGDEPGIGKGRQAAALFRYAQQHGYIPVFFTADAKLFTDIHRDLTDIGATYKPFILGNAKDARILDEEGKLVFKPPANAEARRAVMQKILSQGFFESGFDSIVSIYDQVNQVRDQQAFLDRLVNENKAIIILDESHEAAGLQSMTGVFMRGGTIDRGKGANREKVKLKGLLNEPGGVGAMYLSGTWAKRAENLPLYFKTSLGKATEDMDVLINAMKKGGLAMQQAVTEALAKDGQYTRRERDFRGTDFVTKLIGAEQPEKLINTVDSVTDVLREIRAFSRAVRSAVRKGALGEARPTAQTDIQIDVTDFASISHNYVSQLLLAAKVPEVIREAVDAHARGHKPVIVLMNTMETLIEDFAEQRGLKRGDRVELSYRDFLQRALDRTLRATEKEASGNSRTFNFTAGDVGLEPYYRQIARLIERLDVSLPVSPIDALRYGLEKAGIRVGELTARQVGIRYESDDWSSGIFERRAKADKNAVVNGFNAGHLDALIVNASGAMGLSIHASPQFIERPIKPRIMIIAQPHLDVAIVAQQLLRIKRTGMIPGGASYLVPMSPLQVEMRPVMVLERKMKSLNANTTASAKGKVAVAPVDFLNKYGDDVVGRYLVEQEPELLSELGMEQKVKVGESGEISVEQGTANTFLGRMALMPNERQRVAFDWVTKEYNEYVEYLKATDQYDLEVKVYDDWDGKLLHDEVLATGTDENSIFTASVKLQKWEVKDTRHVPTADEMEKEFGKNLKSAEATLAKVEQFEGVVRKRIENAREELELEVAGVPPEKQGLLEARQRRLSEFENQFRNTTMPYLRRLADDAGVFMRVTERETGDEALGMVTDIVLPKQTATTIMGRPGSVTLIVHTNRPGGRLRVPLSKVASGEVEITRGYVAPTEVDQVRLGGRFERYVLVGNPIRAFDAVAGKGRLVSFKSADGNIISGIVMPMSWRPEQMAKDPRADLVNGKAVRQWIEQQRLSAQSKEAILGPAYGYGTTIRLTVPAARARGGDIYLDKGIRELTGDFEKRGNNMSVAVPDAHVERVTDLVMQITKAPFRPLVRGEGIEPEVIQKVQAINEGLVGKPKPPIPLVEPEAIPVEAPVLPIASLDELARKAAVERVPAVAEGAPRRTLEKPVVAAEKVEPRVSAVVEKAPEGEVWREAEPRGITTEGTIPAREAAEVAKEMPTVPPEAETAAEAKVPRPTPEVKREAIEEGPPAEVTEPAARPEPPTVPTIDETLNLERECAEKELVELAGKNDLAEEEARTLVGMGAGAPPSAPYAEAGPPPREPRDWATHTAEEIRAMEVAARLRERQDIERRTVALRPEGYGRGKAFAKLTTPEGIGVKTANGVPHTLRFPEGWNDADIMEWMLENQYDLNRHISLTRFGRERGTEVEEPPGEGPPTPPAEGGLPPVTGPKREQFRPSNLRSPEHNFKAMGNKTGNDIADALGWLRSMRNWASGAVAGLKGEMRLAMKAMQSRLGLSEADADMELNKALDGEPDTPFGAPREDVSGLPEVKAALRARDYLSAVVNEVMMSHREFGLPEPEILMGRTKEGKPLYVPWSAVLLDFWWPRFLTAEGLARARAEGKILQPYAERLYQKYRARGMSEEEARATVAMVIEDLAVQGEHSTFEPSLMFGRTGPLDASYYEQSAMTKLARIERTLANSVARTSIFGGEGENVRRWTGELVARYGRESQAVRYFERVMRNVEQGAAPAPILGPVAGVSASALLSAFGTAIKNLGLGYTMAFSGLGRGQGLTILKTQLQEAMNEMLQVLPRFRGKHSVAHLEAQRWGVLEGQRGISNVFEIAFKDILFSPLRVIGRILSLPARVSMGLTETVLRTAAYKALSKYLDTLVRLAQGDKALMRKLKATDLLTNPEGYVRHQFEEVLKIRNWREIMKRTAIHPVTGTVFTPREYAQICTWGVGRNVGIVDLSNQPLAMSERPYLGLLWRYAYQGSRTLLKDYVGQAAHGNPGALLRYLTGVALVGSMLTGYRWLKTGRTGLEGKDPEEAVWNIALKGEIFQLFTNAFQGRGFEDAFLPVIYANTVRQARILAEYFSETRTGRQALRGLAGNVPLTNEVMQVLNRFRSPFQVEMGARRAEAREVLEERGIIETPGFAERLFGSKAVARTVRSPSYDEVRDAFWTGDAQKISDAVTRAYVNLTELRKVGGKDAKALINEMVWRLRPVPVGQEKYEALMRSLPEAQRKRLNQAQRAFARFKAEKFDRVAWSRETGRRVAALTQERREAA